MTDDYIPPTVAPAFVMTACLVLTVLTMDNQFMFAVSLACAVAASAVTAYARLLSR